MIGVVVVIILILGVIGIFAWTPEAEAERLCKEQIERLMRNPDSAQWERGIVTGGPTRYTVSLTVRSENGFGGMQRVGHRCIVIFDREPTSFFDVPPYSIIQ